MTRYNYEKDFEIEVELPECVGNNDFKIVFYTKGYKEYVANRENKLLSNNIRRIANSNKYRVVFRKHGLPCGELKSRGYCWLPDNFSPDGVMQERIKVIAPFIELWEGESDDEC